MDHIIIQGGIPLKGTVTAAGAKNAALPILASTILGGGECLITNLPQVRDTTTLQTLLGLLGASVKTDEGRVAIDTTALQSTEAPYDLVKTMRASILVLGPLLTRFGEATVSLPGGCAIGLRPVNLHLDGLRQLGASITLEKGYIHAQASKLQGGQITLEIPTVTGTENLMMAACLAEGTTVIDNAAQEPEVVDLASFLVKRGARIAGAGSNRISVEGVRQLHGAEHQVMPDRVEAATYLMAGAITHGDIQVDQCIPQHLEAVSRLLQSCGADISQSHNTIRIKTSSRLHAVDVTTQPYPGFPTDLQAQMMAVMSVAEGKSIIHETIFEGRFLHVPELQRMGAAIEIDGARALVQGASTLTGAPVMASDLRASAGLVLAGLAAEGETRLSRIYHLERGYERMVDKLQGLGAMIQQRAAWA
ncbi:MAG: UDP-N-acetylglucosamine 1-carboxyvinyltransferase [Nitrospirales bacterium]|nr:UDP-N-acetylglucosamine 1-carboxyvinyltransferase [Nitrospirales bacterium]